MKRTVILLSLLLPSIFFLNAGTAIKINSKHKPGPNTVLLVYTGSMSGAGNLSFGIHIEIDSSIGYRYEVVAERGTSVLSHTVLFYKFAQPNQSIVYNYLTKKSFVNSRSGSPKNLQVAVMGKAVIDSFTCTHLQYANTSAKTQSDYWMSPQVPEFSMIVNVAKNMGTDMLSQVLPGSVFNWGGLVQMTSVRTATPSSSATIKLKEATTGLDLPASDFDVPQS
jgi:hypothetical protein